MQAPESQSNPSQAETPVKSTLIGNTPERFGKGGALRPRLNTVRRGILLRPDVRKAKISEVAADLAAIRTAWKAYQSSRAQAAVYPYQAAIYQTVVSWDNADRLDWNLREALDLLPAPVSLRSAEPFTVAIFVTADPNVVDAKTRSKWSRVLRYAWRRRIAADRLEGFIRSRGGINACADRFARSRSRR